MQKFLKMTLNSLIITTRCVLQELLILLEKQLVCNDIECETPQTLFGTKTKLDLDK